MLLTRKPFVLTALAIIVFLASGSCVYSQVTYSDSGWTSWTGTGPWGRTLHFSSKPAATATIQDTGTEAFIIHKMGPDCGIFQAVVDGQESTKKEIDTYSPLVLWNRKSVVASGLANGPHTVVVTVTGRKNAASSDSSVRITDKWVTGRGVWTTEKAWAWYKARPWIVGWNYLPSTCVNSTEWWQDETHVTDSNIHRELGLGEQLGYTSIRVFLQYIVWVKDSAYLKNRFSRFLTIADSHHFTVTPVLFDDVNYKGADPALGDQGQPVAGEIMSQWTPSPGPTLALATAERPRLKRYVQDMIETYAQDGRILMWDLYNSPGNSGMGIRTFSLVDSAFHWAREIGPSQPLICAEWTGYTNLWPYDLSDICTFHGCTDNAGVLSDITKLRCSQRPVIATEWLARKLGSNILIDLPLFKRQAVGCFSWGLINGRLQCQYPWGNPVNGPIDSTGWFHDILYNSGKPYRAEEVDAIRKNFAYKTINWVAGATDGAIAAKNGCTDPRYSQYDSMATVDNGSCTTLLPPLVVRGCLDSTSKSYNPLATQNDSALCNAAAVRAPAPAKATKARVQGSFGFIGNGRIRVPGRGATQVELFSPGGRLVWSGKADAPCVLDLGKSLNRGVYFARVSRNGLMVMVLNR